MSKTFKILFSLLVIVNLIIIYSIQHDTTSKLNNLSTSLETKTDKPYPVKETTIHQENKPFNKLKETIYVIRPFTIESPHYGTGILIKKNILVTAWHVLKKRYKEIPKKDWSNINIHIQKNRFNDSDPHDARLIAYNKKHDLAILSVEDVECPCVPLYDGEISYDETTYTAYQLNTINTEIITQGRLINKSPPIYYTTNPVFYGASGGGLFIKRNDQFFLIGTIRSMPVGTSRGKIHLLNYITISTSSEHTIKLLKRYHANTIDIQRYCDILSICDIFAWY